MKQELIDGVCWYCEGLILGSVYILPEDLSALLSHSGNPFVSRWDDDEENGKVVGEEDKAVEDEEDESYKAEFDLNNPAHCNALYERLVERIS